MREVDPARFRITLVHREINDPAEAEGVFLNQIKLFRNPRPDEPGKFRHILTRASREEDSVPRGQATASRMAVTRCASRFLAIGPFPPSSSKIM